MLDESESHHGVCPFTQNEEEQIEEESNRRRGSRDKPLEVFEEGVDSTSASDLHQAEDRVWIKKMIYLHRERCRQL